MTAPRWTALLETLRLAHRVMVAELDPVERQARAIDPAAACDHYMSQRTLRKQLAAALIDVDQEALAEACRETLQGVARG